MPAVAAPWNGTRRRAMPCWKAAGGSVTRLDDTPLYGKTRDGFTNPFFVARGNTKARG